MLGENPIIINNLGVTKKRIKQNPNSRNRCSNRSNPKWIRLQFKIDKSKITPCNKNTGASTTSLGMIMAQSDYFLGTLQVKKKL